MSYSIRYHVPLDVTIQETERERLQCFSQPTSLITERGNGTPHAGVARAFTPAEDMGIVLLETAHPGETLQSTAVLISVQHTKVSQSQRKLSV